MTAATDFAAGLGDLVAAVRDTAPDLGGQIAALVALTQIPGTGPVAAGTRRLAVLALTEAAAAYIPTSYDDAQTVLATVAAALDAEITVAGDAGDDRAFMALYALRSAVVADLTERGASLAPMVTRRFGANLPAVVIAAALYNDASRSDELVRRVDPIHPLFMPTVMRVLGA